MRHWRQARLCVRVTGCRPQTSTLCGFWRVRWRGWLPVSAWLDEHGPLDAKGKPRSAANWERRLTSTAAKLLGSLGMNPAASRARLGVDIKRLDLANAMSSVDPAEQQQMLDELGLGGG